MSDLAPPPTPTDDPLERTVRHIDANLFEPLSLAELARVAGLSAFHFSRQFSARFDISPMAYVRARRLAAAAARLCSVPVPPLIDLAFDCGFDSQEGFTRAFKRAFGVSPGRYRRAADQPKEMFPMTVITAPSLTLIQSPAPVRKPALRIAGFSGLFNDSNKAGIPPLWDRLVPRLPIPGQAGWETYGVCAEQPGGEPGAMRYMAGVALDADAPAPEGLEVIDLAAQSYLVFRQTIEAGPLQPQMLAAAKEIWGERLPKSGRRLVQAPDLEFYPPDFEPGKAGVWVEWWVPVEA
jgi:AraC family transcriptional regulator